jgi:hypothetical protein
MNSRTVFAGTVGFTSGERTPKPRGAHMGRPPKLTPQQPAEALRRRDNGETLTDIARTYAVAHTTKTDRGAGPTGVPLATHSR